MVHNPRTEHLPHRICLHFIKDKSDYEGKTFWANCFACHVTALGQLGYRWIRMRSSVHVNTWSWFKLIMLNHFFVAAIREIALQLHTRADAVSSSKSCGGHSWCLCLWGAAVLFISTLLLHPSLSFLASHQQHSHSTLCLSPLSYQPNLFLFPLHLLPLWQYSDWVLSSGSCSFISLSELLEPVVLRQQTLEMLS